ncbi:hypothetical protein D5086_018523 [Populus alba]|uniref:Uncharacterized protein n=1 Tax=Populus alba TaxID=43335 RepID=A0ACC4BPX4_POPAL
MAEPIDNSYSNKEINNGSTESTNENNSNNDEENKKKNKKVDPELFSCLLQPITSDFGPRYIGIRRLLLFRKARSGVHRRLDWRCNGKVCDFRNYIRRPRNWDSLPSHQSTTGNSGRWLQSTSPLSHLFEVDSWTSSQNLQSINPSSTRRTSFSSTASDNDSLRRQGPEPAYSFVGMHCIFDQCKAAVTVLKFGYMSSDVSEPPSVIKKLEGHSKDVTDFDFSSNNQYIASAFMDKTVRVWEVSKGICIRVIYGVSSQLCIGFHPYNDSSSYACRDVYTKQARTHTQVCCFGLITIEVVARADIKLQLYVAGSEDSNVYFYDLTRPKHTCVNKLQSHRFPVGDVAWNHGENLLATSDINGIVIVWKREKTKSRQI